eukprot:COSAG02_NODE_1837_length_10712_cov_4.781306_6_plen_281_part_00
MPVGSARNCPPTSRVLPRTHPAPWETMARVVDGPGASSGLMRVVLLWLGVALRTVGARAQAGVLWTTSGPKIEISEDGAVASAVGTGMDSWQSALCDAPACTMEDQGRYYVEVEWLAGKMLMVGVAGPKFDPTKGKPGEMATRSRPDGWAYSAWSDGRLYRDGRPIDWAGFETGAAVGDRIGLLVDLSRGTLSLRINDEWQGDMVKEGLQGPLRWSVDLFRESSDVSGSSVRVRGLPAPSDPGIERTLRNATKQGDATSVAALLAAGAQTYILFLPPHGT